jgi:MinD-like ATPase involved in chromosome partitioning or flagellar assembly
MSARANPPENTAPMIDGRPVPDRSAQRLRWQATRLLSSGAEREEAELERRLRGQPAVTRPNLIAVLSPKRGLGKSTISLLLGSLFATHLKLRALAIDTSPDDNAFPLPAGRRAERSASDLLDDLDRLHTAASLHPYLARTPTGLHLLAAHRSSGVEREQRADRYGELVAYLSCFYEAVVLDLRGALAPLAIQRADQLVLVITPPLICSSTVAMALERLEPERTTVVINQSLLRPADTALVEERWRDSHRHRVMSVPYDERLAGMLESGTYSLEALCGTTRRAIKRLGLGITERLV